MNEQFCVMLFVFRFLIVILMDGLVVIMIRVAFRNMLSRVGTISLM